MGNSNIQDLDGMVSVPRRLLIQAHDAMILRNGVTVESAQLRAILFQPAEQHQGEPVAWRYRTHAGGLWYLSSSEHNARIFENAEQGSSVEPLYTHADPGDVERLRGIIRMHEKTVQEQAEQLAHMRAQLAERDERIELHVKRRMDLAEQITGLHRQIKQLRATLQTVVDGGQWGAEGRSHEEALKACAGALADGEKPKAKPGVFEIENCTFDNRPIPSGYTLGVSAEPSAPVERDERAEFDAAYERGDFYIEEQRSYFKYQDYRRHQAWAVWQARAALERKS